MGLVSELKRRNVFRMAVLYVVAAWAIMQVAEVIIALANLPDWVGPVILALLSIGFPIALILSWFYEITPDGISLEKDVAPGASITHITGRRLDFLIISVLCAAVVLFAYDKWWTPGPPERSIAVLPFKNTGPELDNAGFLANGIQDDLITRLSKIGDLKVISRTSVERYRNTTESIVAIGKQLGVSRILEGGIQRAADRIRVNVQLIDAVRDVHLWAETYDRNLTATDIFSVQSEIVETIARQLKANLTDQETRKLAHMPTQNLAAYTAYLQGKEEADAESVESLNRAIRYFEQATREDPQFALAYVGLADAYLTLGANFLGVLPTDQSNVLAEPPLTKALQLDPQLGQAYASLGFLRQQQGDWQAAEDAYREAISLQPNYSRAFMLYASLRHEQGRHDESLELLQQALNLDPYSAPVNFDLARSNDLAGNFDEALRRYLRVVEIEPDHAHAYVYIAALHYLVFGRVDESLVWYKKAADNDALGPNLRSVPAGAYLELGDPDSAKDWIDQGRELGPKTFWPMWTGLLHSIYTGDETAAQLDARALLDVYPQSWGALWFLRNLDLAAGRPEVARLRYARAHPELTGPEAPKVTIRNFRAAIDLALVLTFLGQQDRADQLLGRSLEVIDTLPRLGTEGYWISDVRIHALQNRPQQALDALGQAIDEGWRLFTWLYLKHDPNLDSIRRDPEFERLYAELQEDLAAQSQRVRNLKASGDL